MPSYASLGPGMRLVPVPGDLPQLSESRMAGKILQDEPYFTYVGGSGSDFGIGLHVFADGEVVVGLQSNSVGLPVSDDAPQVELNGNLTDAYLIRFRPETGEIVWATYFGSDLDDFLYGLACLDGLGHCAFVGATQGVLPGSGIEKPDRDDFDAFIVLIDATTGQLVQVSQSTHPFHDVHNRVIAAPAPEAAYVTAGYQSNGTDLNGSITIYASGDDFSGVVLVNDDPSIDDIWFDLAKIGNVILAVGAADPEIDENVFTSEPIVPHVGFAQGAELTTAFTVGKGNAGGPGDDEGRWYEDVTVSKLNFPDGFACSAAALSQAFVITQYAVDCFPTQDLPGDFEARRTVLTGDGFPHDVAVDPSGYLYIVVTKKDEQGAPDGIDNYLVDYWSDAPTEPRSYLELFPQMVAVDEYLPALSGHYYYGTANTGAETSPTAPGPFKDLPSGGVAGGFYKVVGPAYGAIINLEQVTISDWGMLFRDTGGTERSIASRYKEIPYARSSGAIPYPRGRQATINIEQRDPVELPDDGDITYHFVKGDDSFSATTSEIPARKPSYLWCNVSRRTVSIRVATETNEEPFFNGSREWIGRTCLATIKTLETEGDLRVEVFDPLNGDSEEWRIPKEFVDEEVLEDPRQKLFILDDVPAVGKTSAQTFQLLAFDFTGETFDIQLVTDIEESGEFPSAYRLHQNYPNPFNPSTEIVFELPVGSPVRLTIANALGQAVWEWSSYQVGPGSHAVSWNGADNSGNRVPSGLYLYRLEAGEHVETRMMSLVR